MSTKHVETLLPPVIRTAFPGVRVVTETPANLADVRPCISVVGIGGSGDRYQFDSSRVDFDVFDVAHDDKTARENARALAQQLHDWLLQVLPDLDLADGASVLSVSEFLSPTWTPYDNTDVRRFVLSVSIRLHTRSIA